MQPAKLALFPTFRFWCFLIHKNVGFFNPFRNADSWESAAFSGLFSGEKVIDFQKLQRFSTGFAASRAPGRPRSRGRRRAMRW